MIESLLWCRYVTPLLLATPTWGQCYEWSSEFAAPVRGVSGAVRSQIVFDDGSGSALFATGSFTFAEGVDVFGLAKWANGKWSKMGQFGAPAGSACAIFDAGSGAALYVGGSFTVAGDAVANNVVGWDGANWFPLGTGLTSGALSPRGVRALAVFNDGFGNKLYAGGQFSMAGGASAINIACWDGVTWTALAGGVGINGPSSQERVSALCVFDDGSGPALYAGGLFATAGGVPASNVAKWNGSSWAAVRAGFDHAVDALCTFQSGVTSVLVAGGDFTASGSTPLPHIAQWNGTSWAGLSSGIDGPVRSLVVSGIGGSPALFAGGKFGVAGGAPCPSIARWNGSNWAPLGSGLSASAPPAEVLSFAEHDDGTGLALWVGGAFSNAGGSRVDNEARWTGSQWNAVGRSGAGFEPSFEATPVALASHDDGGGTRLYAAGLFERAGGVAAKSVASWDGLAWSPVGNGIGVGTEFVSSLFSVSAGLNQGLYAGGRFSAAGAGPAANVAVWNGAHWSPLGSGTNGAVTAFCEFDEGAGPVLFVGGEFSNAGSSAAAYLSRWNGGAWSAVGSGTDGPVYALTTFDDGTGAALYAAGSFTVAGGQPASNIARWDGAAWTALGPGLDGDVYALRELDIGSGTALYAAGRFSHAGGLSANAVARWDGLTWSAVGAGVDGVVNALEVFDDGSGNALYACGRFSHSGITPAKRVARWNGANWMELHGGLGDSNSNQPVAADAQAFDDGQGTGPALYIAGLFGSANGTPSAGIAVWRGCSGTGTAVCSGDGGVVSCPCGNNGTAGHGCANSAFGNGALLSGSGLASVASDTVRLSAWNLTGSTAVFFQASAQQSPLVIDDGIGCASGQIVRLGTKSVAANSSAFPHAGDPLISVRGLVPAAGGVRFYQCFYRNAVGAFCPPATSNRTNGVAISWMP